MGLVSRGPDIPINAAPDWEYSPRSGWHLIYNRKKRWIFYLIPTRGGFRLSLLKEAKRYPEGTAFSLTGQTLDIELAVALLEVKIAH